MSLLQLTSEEIAQNESGLISKRQRDALHKHRLRNGLGSAGFLVLLVLVVIGIAYKVADPGFGARGPFWLVGLFSIFWLVLLGRACLQYGRIRRDLREGHVASVVGPVMHHQSASPGVIHVLRYRIRCAGRWFSVSQEVFFQLQGGMVYRIYYAPRSNIFLGTVSASAVPPATEAESHSVESGLANPVRTGIEPLLQREQEVLELIAAGLSNQEIADELYLSIHTVKMYASQLYRKMGVRRRTEAVQRAREAGLLPPIQ